MIFINTIRRTGYNIAEREKLGEEYTELFHQAEKMREQLDEIDDDDEYESAFDAWVAFTDNAVNPAYRKCFAAQFHNCKNEWFNKVVSGFEIGKTVRITERQYNAFSRYACDKDSNSWRTGESYCRCGKYLVTLCRRYINSSIKVEKL